MYRKKSLMRRLSDWVMRQPICSASLKSSLSSRVRRPTTRHPDAQSCRKLNVMVPMGIGITSSFSVCSKVIVVRLFDSLILKLVPAESWSLGVNVNVARCSRSTAVTCVWLCVAPISAPADRFRTRRRIVVASGMLPPNALLSLVSIPEVPLVPVLVAEREGKALAVCWSAQVDCERCTRFCVIVVASACVQLEAIERVSCCVCTGFMVFERRTDCVRRMERERVGVRAKIPMSSASS